MKPSKLLLDSKNDIPFLEGTVTIHPPTISEIGIIGEEAFFGATHLLTFSKDKFLSFEEREKMQNTSDFDIFIQIMNDTATQEIQETRAHVIMLLALLFPDYEIHIEKDMIELVMNEDNKGHIDNSNYDSFKELIFEMFCMKPLQGEDYKPKGKLAQKIAAKIAEGKKKAAELKGEKGAINVFQKYISILSIGMNIDKNALYQYTVYQLYDSFERYQLKFAYDAHIQALLAGAKMDKEPDQWQKDLDEKSNNDQS